MGIFSAENKSNRRNLSIKLPHPWGKLSTFLYAFYSPPGRPVAQPLGQDSDMCSINQSISQSINQSVNRSLFAMCLRCIFIFFLSCHNVSRWQEISASSVDLFQAADMCYKTRGHFFSGRFF